MRFLLAVCCILLAGCKTVPPADLDQANRTRMSTLRAERQAEAATHSLKQKAALIAKRLNTSLVDPATQLPKQYITASDEGPLHTELAAVYLASLSYQYSVAQKPSIRQQILKVLNGIKAADRANGYDGYLPTTLRREGGQLVVIRNETHMNLYTQLLHAYTLTLELVADREIQDATRKHMEMIFAHLLKDELQLHDEEGNRMPHSNLRISQFTLSPADRLDGTVFLEVGIRYLSSDFEHYPKLEELKEKADRIYDNSGPMHINFGGLELPTASSSWLNLLSMDTHCHLVTKSNQRTRILELASIYSSHENPFFLGLVAKHAPDQRAQLISRVEARLKEYPASCRSDGMINSYREDIEIATQHYIKTTAYPRTTKALPLYEIDSDRYLWKRDLLRADARHPAGRTYTGIDYLHAYWQLQYVKTLR